MGKSKWDSRFRWVSPDQIKVDPTLARWPREPSELDALIRSMKSHGQLSPIVVRLSPDGDEFLVIVGARRREAAGTQDVLVQIVDVDDLGATLIRLSEEFTREPLSTLDRGRLIDIAMKLGGHSLRGLANEWDRDHSGLSRARTLHLRLSPEAQNVIRRGGLPDSTARVISRLPRKRQLAVARKAVKEGLTCDQVEEMIAPTIGEGGKRPGMEKLVFKLPGHCKVVVWAPTGSSKETWIRALVTALARLTDESLES